MPSAAMKKRKAGGAKKIKKRTEPAAGKHNQEHKDGLDHKYDSKTQDAKNDYNSSNEDYSDDGDEDAESYKPGGYHPVKIGDIYNKRYLVVEKLGWGHFSTVWMCRDQISPAAKPKYVAMKIQKSASHYREAAFDEIELLRCISVATTKERALKEYGPGYDCGTVTLLDHFEHTGPHGKHVCMVFEMLGENLLRVIKNYDYRGISIPVVRNMTRQICLALDFLHRHSRIIHTDLKPENILVAVPPPPPSDLFIKSLIAQQHSRSNTKKKPKKASAKKPNKHAEASGSKASESKSDALSMEEKKKMKRKMKKKRQRAKKGDKSGTGTGTGRRKGTGGNTEPAHALSAIDELREMELMEQASEPIAYMASADAVEGMPSSVPSSRNSSGALSWGGGETEDDEEYDPLNQTASSYQTSLASLSTTRQEQFSALLPLATLPWLRHTLLGTLNFRCTSQEEVEKTETPARPALSAEPVIVVPAHVEERDAIQASPISVPPMLATSSVTTASAISPRIQRGVEITAISSDQWTYPSSALWSTVHMVIPAKRVWEVLSALPQQTTSLPPFDLENAAYSEWYCRMTVDQRPGESLQSVESRRQFLSAMDIDSHQFYIKGRGLDTSGISHAIGRCLICPQTGGPKSEKEGSGYSPLVAAGKTPDDDLPVLWTIGHSAVATETIIYALEEMFPGMHFLCQCDAEEVASTSEDRALWGIVESLCQHPFTDEDDAYSRAIIGIDLSTVARSLYPPGYAPPPVGWESTICPLPLRMRIFAGDMEEALFEFQAELDLKKRDMDDEYDDEVEQSRIISDTAVKALDEKYLNAPLKIVDLGNACWIDRHFTDDIQTRQYRSPEVIVGARYDTSADIWSLACIVFELLTGDLLFDPHAGKTWDRDEDHLAMIAELVGGFPRKMATTGKRCHHFFNKKGEFRNIHHLKFWPLEDVLREKYLFDPADAAGIANFLENLLEVDPEKRFTAEECLKHPWLTGKQASLLAAAKPRSSMQMALSSSDSDKSRSGDGKDDSDYDNDYFDTDDDKDDSREAKWSRK
eukprot:CAMPEP_0185030754 /NCGR_PEP_ID=MMETSP1103-20130426/17794_1 /TAXON_ID=36769 /ORGANISM="Paraphysomonas bandaiensis, Strain Caron Lab Isolate" /LENGTH=1040 /DNA_ID=CAMNT_0027565995 /DNA_START=63 /DNA_END=3185 /DNA_ORIENTATION=-